MTYRKRKNALLLLNEEKKQDLLFKWQSNTNILTDNVRGMCNNIPQCVQVRFY